MVNITLPQLGAIMRESAAKGLLDPWVVPLNRTMAEFAVDTPLRAAYFLANAAHETRELQALDENLNYSPHRLAQVWPSHFSDANGVANALAWKLAGRPEDLANYIYADENRPDGYKLGNTQKGDGWRFRGVATTHLTGRANIVPCLRALGRADDDTGYLRTPEGASRGGGWYWRTRKLWMWADIDDSRGFRRAVQGGELGLRNFEGYLGRGKPALLGGAAAAAAIVRARLLESGMDGDDVAALQAALGRRGHYRGRVDGIFGRMTDDAVRAFQAASGLNVDGRVGPLTRQALGL